MENLAYVDYEEASWLAWIFQESTVVLESEEEKRGSVINTNTVLCIERSCDAGQTKSINRT